jgi:hypothetical protein
MMLKMMCGRYRIDICEKVSISLWILGLGSLILLMLVLNITPWIHVVIVMGGLTSILVLLIGVGV